MKVDKYFFKLLKFILFLVALVILVSVLMPDIYNKHPTVWRDSDYCVKVHGIIDDNFSLARMLEIGGDSISAKKLRDDTRILEENCEPR